MDDAIDAVGQANASAVAAAALVAGSKALLAQAREADGPAAEVARLTAEVTSAVQLVGVAETIAADATDALQAAQAAPVPTATTIAVPSARCKLCGSLFDGAGVHILACTNKFGVRHNMTRDALAGAARDVEGATDTIEPPLDGTWPRQPAAAGLAPKGRRGDISVRTARDGGATIIVDVTVINPNPDLPAAQRTVPGATAADKETQKHNNYTSFYVIPNSEQLVPFGVESMRWGRPPTSSSRLGG